MFKKIVAVMVLLSLATLTQGEFLAPHYGDVVWKGSLAQGYEYGADPYLYRFASDWDENGSANDVVGQTVFSSMLLGLFTPRARGENIVVPYYVTESKTITLTNRISFADMSSSAPVAYRSPLVDIDRGQYLAAIGTVTHWHQIVNYMIDELVESGGVGVGAGEQLKATVEDPFWPLFGPEPISLSYTNYYRIYWSMQAIFDMVDWGQDVTTRRYSRQQEEKVVAYNTGFSAGKAEGGGSGGYVPGTPDFIALTNSVYTTGFDAGWVLGTNSGWLSGYTAGHDAGFLDGQAAGFAPGTPEYITLTNTIYVSGYNSGHSVGVQSSDGYDQGYQAGKAELKTWDEMARSGMYNYLNIFDQPGVVAASFKSLNYTATLKVVKNADKTTSTNVVMVYKRDGKKVLEMTEPATPTSPKSISFTLARVVAKKTGYVTDTLTYKVTGLKELAEYGYAPYNFLDQSSGEWKNWLSFATTGSFWWDNRVVAGSNSSVNKGTLPTSYSVTVGKPNAKTGEQSVTIVTKETSETVPDLFSGFQNGG